MQTTLKISEMIRLFIAEQDIQENSKVLYKSNLTQFFLWCSRTGKNARSLHRADILQFKDEMLRTKAVTTTESRLSVVKKFFEWAESNKFYTNIALGIKLPRRRRDFKKQALTSDQAERLLSVIDRSAVVGLRDYAIISLMLRSGLRCIEVARLNIEDLEEIEGKFILKIQGKARTEKDSFVPVTPKALDSINDYLVRRGNLKDGQPMFTNTPKHCRGSRMNTCRMSVMIKNHMKNAGINSPQITAHSLRHTAAVLLLEAGEDIYSVQLLLRHSSSKITEIYLKSIEDKRRLRHNPCFKLDKMIG